MKIHELKAKIDQRINHLKSQLAVMRTGRASSTLVEDIKVDAYEGSPPLTIKELAVIAVPEPTTISIKPWDLSLIPKVERAIRDLAGGLNPVVFDDTIRILLPPLSTERRQEMVRLLKIKVEETKVEIRLVRQDEMRSIDEMESRGVLSKDERFRLREEVEKVVKEKTLEAENLGRSKEEELTSL